MPYSYTLQTTTDILSSSFLSAAPATINGNFNILKQYATDSIAGVTQLANDINALDSTNNVFVTTPHNVYDILKNSEEIMPLETNVYSLGSDILAYKSLFLSNEISGNVYTTEFTIQQTPSGSYAYLDGATRLISTIDIPTPALIKYQPSVTNSISGSIAVGNYDINIGDAGTTFDLPLIAALPYDKVFTLKNIGSIACPVTFFSISGDTSEVTSIAASGAVNILGYKTLNKWIKI